MARLFTCNKESSEPVAPAKASNNNGHDKANGKGEQRIMVVLEVHLIKIFVCMSLSLSRWPESYNKYLLNDNGHLQQDRSQDREHQN